LSAVGEMLESWEDGRIKLYITAAGMNLRRRYRDLFLNGAYVPLKPAGARAEHVVAFARTLGDDSVVTVVPRLVARLCGMESGLPPGPAVWPTIWGETRLGLPGAFDSFRNLLTGERVQVDSVDRHALVADILHSCPVAFLVPLTRKEHA
jgi:(1->4)-alpha-D-glucan 1-alpha-D-glucosylmutase